MQSRSAIRNQLSWLRQLYGLLAWLLLLVGLTVVVIASRHGVQLLRLFSGRDLTALLKLLGALVLVLIPISGIYSVASQYAFWSGWLGGLPQWPQQPDEASKGPDQTTNLGEPPRSAIVYLDGIHQSERDHPPRVSAFLQELETRLPPDIRLLKGLEAYTVTPSRLLDDVGSG